VFKQEAAMQTHGLAILVLLAALALNACDRNKPGNPLPPQKPPAPKLEREGPMKKPVWNVPDQPSRANRA
jgi:hypothetical protein